MIASFKKIYTKIQDLILIQQAIDNVFTDIRNVTLLNGVYLTGVKIGTASTTFAHKLGRLPQGYLLCDVSADTRIFRTAWTASTISLQATTAATINVWIF